MGELFEGSEPNIQWRIPLQIFQMKEISLLVFAEYVLNHNTYID